MLSQLPFKYLGCNMYYDLQLKNGDSGTKRAKVDLDSDGEIIIEPHLAGESVSNGEEMKTTTQLENNEASTSSAAPAPRTDDSSVDQLPKEMHDMKIRDDKADDPCEKVGFASLLKFADMCIDSQCGIQLLFNVLF